MNGFTTITMEAGGEVRAPSRDDSVLQQHIALLEEDDRTLVELARAGVPHRRIAKALGLEPGTVTRRLKRLGQRIHSPIVARLLDPKCPLGPDYRQVGVEFYLTGRTISQIAARLARSRPSVRQTLDTVRAWHLHTHTVARRMKSEA